MRGQLSIVTSLLPPSESGVKLRLSLFIINFPVELSLYFLSLIFQDNLYSTWRSIIHLGCLSNELQVLGWHSHTGLCIHVWASSSRLSLPCLALYTWVLRIQTQELLITWQTLMHLSSVPCIVLVHICIAYCVSQICLLDDLCIPSWWNSQFFWTFGTLPVIIPVCTDAWEIAASFWLQ